MGSGLLLSLSLLCSLPTSAPSAPSAGGYDPDDQVKLLQYIRAADRQAGAAEPCYRVAEHLLQMGDSSEAIRWVNRAEQRERRTQSVTWRPAWYRARALLLADQPQQAVEELNRALALATPVAIPRPPGLAPPRVPRGSAGDLHSLRTARVEAVVRIAEELEARLERIETRLEIHREDSETAANRVFELTRDIDALDVADEAEPTPEELAERSILRLRMIEERDRYRRNQEAARRAELEELAARVEVERLMHDEPARLEWARKEIARLLRENPDNQVARRYQQIVRERLADWEDDHEPVSNSKRSTSN